MSHAVMQCTVLFFHNHDRMTRTPTTHSYYHITYKELPYVRTYYALVWVKLSIWGDRVFLGAKKISAFL
jgi:hypothetical protein